MVKHKMFMMRLYGIKQLENENNGRVILARYKLLPGHKKHLTGRSLPVVDPYALD